MSGVESFLPGLEASSPTVMGPYQVQGILGRGGMGLVYLGVHKETGERVALNLRKVIEQYWGGSLRASQLSRASTTMRAPPEDTADPACRQEWSA